ncbi:inosine monophosphate cyclohydrolase [Lachnoanaerobaculum orale]|uniref:Inosine monophosphate cyclohydrolase n=1 Tax=Lachnoanaerobaculum orale TaxID=979627 RepID=A0A3P3Q5L9_9FIRM|nr:IMP cyclohydrolase [Lachnoanaerobaculum orale]RRJ16522.1 inosine monophosphate cyclohydrolase [Lachnoanaerobaculum orale]
MFDYLAAKEYPGRGIILGKSENNRAVFAYFIMGRSTNSRNRVFEVSNDDIKTKAFDESLLSDPSLIIYSPVRVLGKKIIVTNGDQTDTIYEYLKDKKTFEDALYTRTFEPDAPNFTPRISGLIDIESGLKLKLSILKSDEGDESQALRFFYNYDNPKPGEGFLIHTYKENSDPLKSFEGEPVKVSLKGSIDEFCNSLWNSLNTDNKISLAVRYIDMATGKYEQIIKNKLEGI